MLAEAERSGATAEQGAGTAADWLAVETRQTRRAARADLKFAQRLETYQVLAGALESGDVNTAQARVIVTALDRLPDKGEFAVSMEQRQRAEQHLVAQAAYFDADTLKILGARVFEVIAPEVAETVEGRVLEAQEAKALRKVTFSMWEDAEGICHGQFRVPAPARPDPHQGAAGLHQPCSPRGVAHRTGPAGGSQERAGVHQPPRSHPRDVGYRGTAGWVRRSW